MRAAVLVILMCACSQPGSEPAVTSSPPPPFPAEDKRARFGREVAELLLDTEVYELKGTLSVAISDPDPDDESPLSFEFVQDHPAPGPHNRDGNLHAEIEALNRILKPRKMIKIEGERVFIGKPEVLILGHRHGEFLYVPVKLYARQFGAYVDISSTLATHGTIWTGETIRYMRKSGYLQSGGLIEGWAEGITGPVDVRAKPGY